MEHAASVGRAKTHHVAQGNVVQRTEAARHGERRLAKRCPSRDHLGPAVQGDDDGVHSAEPEHHHGPAGGERTQGAVRERAGKLLQIAKEGKGNPDI